MSKDVLRISKDLALPVEWMTLATVVYGSRGSGKTTFGSVVAEEVTKQRQRFCAIDLKGDWYGLKSTADGKGAGIPVVVFGGDHQDLPLEADAGAFVADTIADLGQSTILDFEYLSKGKQVRFLAQFFERLYDRNRDPLLLLMDEAQRYAPQGRTFSPEQAMCLGAVEDIVKLGRKHGIGVVVFTQRGSGLNKEVSELCDMLVAFRTPGPLDQKRVKEWLDANATAEQGRRVMEQLSGLPTGTAVFASAHPDLTLFAVAPVRRRETFDSSATPRVGQKRDEPKELATPDLDALRTKMAAAIERAKAEDPKELQKALREARAETARVRKQVESRPAEVVQAAPERIEVQVEVPVLDGDAVLRLKEATAHFEGAAATIEQLADEAQGIGVLAMDVLEAARKGLTGRTLTTPAPSRPAPTSRPQGGSQQRRPETDVSARRSESGPVDSSVNGTEQKMLDALGWWESVLGEDATVSRLQVAFVAGYHVRAKAVTNGLGSLNTAARIEYQRPGHVRLTAEGRSLARAPAVIPDTDDLQALVFEQVGAVRSRFLRELIAVYPEAIGREDLAERVGYHPRAKAVTNSLGSLRSLGFIDYPDRGFVRAGAVLFLGDRS